MIKPLRQLWNNYSQQLSNALAVPLELIPNIRLGQPYLIVIQIKWLFINFFKIKSIQAIYDFQHNALTSIVTLDCIFFTAKILCSSEGKNCSGSEEKHLYDCIHSSFVQPLLKFVKTIIVNICPGRLFDHGKSSMFTWWETRFLVCYCHVFDRKSFLLTSRLCYCNFHLITALYHRRSHICLSYWRWWAFAV